MIRKRKMSPLSGTPNSDLAEFVPRQIGKLANPQVDLPRIAKDPKLAAIIESALRNIPTAHDLHLHDARDLSFVKPESVHLVVTSPPYWTLKEYRRAKGQLGFIVDYEEFLSDPSQYREERRAELQADVDDWLHAGQYVLKWNEDYDMSKRGTVFST